MISYELTKLIEKEGIKEGYKLGTCYGKRDEKGYFSFIIELIPTDERAIPSPTDQED